MPTNTKMRNSAMKLCGSSAAVCGAVRCLTRPHGKRSHGSVSMYVILTGLTLHGVSVLFLFPLVCNDCEPKIHGVRLNHKQITVHFLIYTSWLRVFRMRFPMKLCASLVAVRGDERCLTKPHGKKVARLC